MVVYFYCIVLWTCFALLEPGTLIYRAERIGHLRCRFSGLMVWGLGFVVWG